MRSLPPTRGREASMEIRLRGRSRVSYQLISTRGQHRPGVRSTSDTEVGGVGGGGGGGGAAPHARGSFVSLSGGHSGAQCLLPSPQPSPGLRAATAVTSLLPFWQRQMAPGYLWYPSKERLLGLHRAAHHPPHWLLAKPGAGRAGTFHPLRN